MNYESQVQNTPFNLVCWKRIEIWKEGKPNIRLYPAFRNFFISFIIVWLWFPLPSKSNVSILVQTCWHNTWTLSYFCILKLNNLEKKKINSTIYVLYVNFILPLDLFWKRLLAGTIPVRDSVLTGRVPVNNSMKTGNILVRYTSLCDSGILDFSTWVELVITIKYINWKLFIWKITSNSTHNLY